MGVQGCSIRMRLITVQCIMMIIFQNKLIYLPYIPYGARKETIQDYTPQLLGLDWTTSEVRTRDGKKLSTCVAEIRLVLLHAATLLTTVEKQSRRTGSDHRLLSGVSSIMLSSLNLKERVIYAV